MNTRKTGPKCNCTADGPTGCAAPGCEGAKDPAPEEYDPSAWAGVVAKTILANAHLHNNPPGVVNLAKDRDAAWARVAELEYANKWLDVDVGLVLAKLEVVPNLREEIDTQEARANRAEESIAAAESERDAARGDCAGLKVVVDRLNRRYDGDVVFRADLAKENSVQRTRAKKAETLAESWKAEESITRGLLEDEIAKLRVRAERAERQLAEIQAPGNALADHLLGVPD